MTFRDFVNKYKMIAFIVYALAVAVALTFIKTWWINLILILPLLALGVFILIGFFPRRKEGYLTLVCADGLGNVQMTSFAIVKSVREATNAIDGIQYQACTVLNQKDGLAVRIDINIAYKNVMEISEVLRVYVKKLLEKEMNIRVSRIDVIVKNVVYHYKVNKIGQKEPELRQAVIPVEEIYDENAPSYQFRYGESETTFRVPSNNVLRTREIATSSRRLKTRERSVAEAARVLDVSSVPESKTPSAEQAVQPAGQAVRTPEREAAAEPAEVSAAQLAAPALTDAIAGSAQPEPGSRGDA